MAIIGHTVNETLCGKRKGRQASLAFAFSVAWQEKGVSGLLSIVELIMTSNPSFMET